MHRHLGRHISQVKAINTGTYLWMPYELQVMRSIGNGRAARAYRNAPPKVAAGTPAEVKLKRAQALYGDHHWGAPMYEKEAGQRSAAPTAAIGGIATPTQTAPGPPAMSIMKSAARPKLPGATIHKTGPPVCDLIDFDSDEGAVSASQATVACPTSGLLAPEPHATPVQNVTHSTQAIANVGQHEAKKAAILSAFATNHSTCSSRAPMHATRCINLSPHPVPMACPAAVGGSTDFFAQFGL